MSKCLGKDICDITFTTEQIHNFFLEEISKDSYAVTIHGMAYILPRVPFLDRNKKDGVWHYKVNEEKIGGMYMEESFEKMLEVDIKRISKKGEVNEMKVTETALKLAKDGLIYDQIIGKLEETFLG